MVIMDGYCMKLRLIIFFWFSFFVGSLYAACDLDPAKTFGEYAIVAGVLAREDKIGFALVYSNLSIMLKLMAENVSNLKIEPRSFTNESIALISNATRIPEHDVASSLVYVCSETSRLKALGVDIAAMAKANSNYAKTIQSAAPIRPSQPVNGLSGLAEAFNKQKKPKPISIKKNLVPANPTSSPDIGIAEQSQGNISNVAVPVVDLTSKPELVGALEQSKAQDIYRSDSDSPNSSSPIYAAFFGKDSVDYGLRLGVLVFGCLFVGKKVHEEHKKLEVVADKQESDKLAGDKKFFSKVCDFVAEKPVAEIGFVVCLAGAIGKTLLGGDRS